MISCTENHSRPTHSAKGSDKWIQKIWNLILILIGISITREQNEVLSLKFCNVGVKSTRRYVGLHDNESDSVFRVKRGTRWASLLDFSLHCHRPIGSIIEGALDESAVDGMVNEHRCVARLQSANSSAVLKAKETCKGDRQHGNMGTNSKGS